MGTLHGILTGLLVIAFIGIVLWAYSSKKKPDFEEAARLAVDDDEAFHQAARIQRNRQSESGKMDRDHGGQT